MNNARSIRQALSQDRKEETLFIPIGYGAGTIVYDKNNNPYLVGKSIGGSLHVIKEITQEEAKTRIDTGSKVLTSQQNVK